MVRLLALTISLSLACAGAASAASQLRAIPDTTTTGTHLHLFTDAAELGGRMPSGLSLRIARGFVVNTRAVPGRCTDDQATKAACPIEARVARGAAMVEASTLTGSQEYRARIDVFLTDARQGDFAGVIVTVEVQNDRRSARGRVIALPEPPFGYEVRFDSFPTPELPPGVTLKLKSFELDTGGELEEKRVVRCAKRSKTCRPKPGCRSTRTRRCKLYRTKIVRRHLLTTPASCSGSWPAQAEARFEDGTTAIIDAPIPCRTGA